MRAAEGVRAKAGGLKVLGTWATHPSPGPMGPLQCLLLRVLVLSYRLLRSLPPLPLLPGTFLFAEYSSVGQALTPFSLPESTQMTALSVSLAGNSTYILSPFHFNYNHKSTTLLDCFGKLQK